MYGVCRIISPVGPMEGACGGRLLFIFIATLASIIIKGLSMCVVIHFIEEDRYGSELKVIFLMLIFLPQLIMSLISTTGFFNFEFREFFKLISHHPDLILLPLGTKQHLIKCTYEIEAFSGTIFTYKKMSICCGPKDSRIRFSKSWTLFNFFLSTLQILGCGALLYEHVYVAKSYNNAAEVIQFIWAKNRMATPEFPNSLLQIHVWRDARAARHRGRADHPDHLLGLGHVLLLQLLAGGGGVASV